MGNYMPTYNLNKFISAYLPAGNGAVGWTRNIKLETRKGAY